MICVKCHQSVPDMPYCGLCGHKQSTPVRATYKRGNGQGTAIKRGKTWTGIRMGYITYTFDDDGTPHQHRKRPSKGGFKTKKEALEWACSQTDANNTVPRLVEVYESYKQSDMTSLSKSKQTAYKIARDKLEPIIALRMDQIALDDIQKCINEKAPTYYPARDIKVLLSHLYKRANANNSGLDLKDLSKYITLPPKNETKANPIIQTDLHKIWKSFEAGNTFSAIILLMCYTGMMPGEVMQCKKDMVDTKAREIRNAGIKTKTRKDAVIVYPEALDDVMSLIMQSNGDRLIHINKDRFYAEFYASLEAAGIDNSDKRYTPYSCRHTFGTEAVKAGLHPELIKKMLRHSTMAMQEQYTHLAESDVHDGVNLILGGLHLVDKSNSDTPKT